MIRNAELMTEEIAKDIARSILVGIDELHKTNTVAVILNPWNIKFNKEYALFLDIIWCISRQIKEVDCALVDGKFLQYYGNPRLPAPELHEGKPPQKSNDWWSFGAIIYEMIFGCSPFYSQSKKIMQEMKLSKKDLNFPVNVSCSHDLKDLLRGLLCPDPIQRLGWQKGAAEIKKHPWFQTQPLLWEKINDIDNRSLPEENAKIIYESTMGDQSDEYMCSGSSCRHGEGLLAKTEHQGRRR